MLQVSDAAATALRDARDQQDLPDTFGVRLFAEPHQSGQLALSLAFCEEPEEGDEVIEQSGTEVYVAPEVLGTLSESIIDIAQTDEGAPQLVIKPQGE